LFLLAAGVGVVCFLGGRWSVLARNVTGEEGSGMPGSGKYPAGRDKIADSPPPRRHAPGPVKKEEAAPVADTGEDMPKMAVPRSVVRDLLKKELSAAGFDSLEEISRTTNGALDLLDVTDEERKEVLAAVQGMKEEVKEAERKTAVEKAVTDSSVVLDMSGMRGELEGIRARMDLGIGVALKREKANLLIDAFRWDLMYPENEMTDVAFSIQRAPGSGTLMATRKYSGNRMSVGLRNWSAFKDDGKPLAAGAVFEGRWAHLLEGRKLLPVDMEK